MKYICECCNYSTNNLGNFNRHQKSTSHKDKIIKTPNYICECRKQFSHSSSLYRHKKQCNENNNENDDGNNNDEHNTNLNDEPLEVKNKQIEQLINTVNTLVNKVTNLESQINESKQIAPITNNNYNYINISVKNYVKQYWQNAPAISKLENYKIEDVDPDRSLIDALVYQHNNNSLPAYLGDYIIKNYKKDDRSQQSVWTSDVPRLNFIIKELIANGNSEWIDDIKGKKVKTYIINPFLEYIDKECQLFYNKNNKNLKKFEQKTKNRTIPFGDNEIKESLDTLNIYKTINAIKNTINCGTLANDIIKYIAQELYLDKDIRKIKNNNMIEIDENQENNLD